MNRALTVQDVAIIVDMIKGADVTELHEELTKPNSSGAEARLVFELRAATLSVIEGAPSTPHYPLLAAETVARLALEFLGLAMRAVHDGRPPCPQCFHETSHSLVRELAEAAGLVANPPPFPVGGDHGLRH